MTESSTQAPPTRSAASDEPPATPPSPSADPETLFLGGSGPDAAAPETLRLAYANRHGLISGATGTGKTVTLQIMAEAFSNAGVPVFVADVKGDLSGLAAPGAASGRLHPKLVSRAERIGLADYRYRAAPVVFWDVFGEHGHPMRANLSALGPLALGRLLDLNEVQEGVLHVLFRAAQDDGLALIDLKDLRAMLAETGRRARELSTRYGAVSGASVAAIQRRLLMLESEGAGAFFGEPQLDLADLLAQTSDGRGRVSVLHAVKLMRSPRLYAMTLFWLLSRLFDELPELGDPEKPVLAFFFDEAHLLFDDAPPALIDKIEQIARLIRSKGVGVYFVTQSPADLPETVLGQLGARVQHALRAFTPKDRKALRAAAETFRPNPAFDTETALPTLGVGEALVSTLGRKGAPSVVARTLIRPPSSRIGPLRGAERAAIIAASPLHGRYEQAIDRVSAYEILSDALSREESAAGRAAKTLSDTAERRRGGEPYSAPPRHSRAERIGGGGSRSGSASRSRRGDSASDAFLKSLARSVGTRAGRGLWKAVGGLFKR